MLPRCARGFVGAVIALSAGCASAAEAPDAAELYDYLFPAQKEGQSFSGLSGFTEDDRRQKWSAEQKEALRRVFNQTELSGESVSPEPHQNGGEAGSFDSLIEEYAARRHLSVDLVYEVIAAESQFDPNAISPKGAKGLMQLMDPLSERFNIDPFDPESNISVGTQYLAEMLARFGSVELALAAYNAGPANVEKYDGVPPFSETQSYVKKILERLREKEVRQV